MPTRPGSDTATNAQHNAGGYIYQAQNRGLQGAAPNPWNQTIGGNQSDGSVTWKNMGPVSTNPITAILIRGCTVGLKRSATRLKHH
jgi:hypothetical protein